MIKNNLIKWIKKAENYGIFQRKAVLFIIYEFLKLKLIHFLNINLVLIAENKRILDLSFFH